MIASAQNITKPMIPPFNARFQMTVNRKEEKLNTLKEHTANEIFEQV